jgi:hypothetical protein
VYYEEIRRGEGNVGLRGRFCLASSREILFSKPLIERFLYDIIQLYRLGGNNNIWVMLMWKK